MERETRIVESRARIQMRNAGYERLGEGPWAGLMQLGYPELKAQAKQWRSSCSVAAGS